MKQQMMKIQSVEFKEQKYKTKMDKLLKKVGLYDTRHQLKFYPNSQQMKSPPENNQSFNSENINKSKSRICGCKQQTLFITQRKKQQNSNSKIRFSSGNESIKKQQQEFKGQDKNNIKQTKHQNNKNNKNQYPNLSSNGKSKKSEYNSKQMRSNSKQMRSNSKQMGSNSKQMGSNSKQMGSNSQFVKKNSNKKQQSQQTLQKGSNLYNSKSANKIYSKQQNRLNKFKEPSQNNKIQEIIEYLKYKLNCKCTLDNHQHNKISYICLQQNCQNRIGCSYCFLHNHENHLKTQITTTIKDLQELSFKINANYILYTNKINSIYEQFYQKLYNQINHVIQQFQTNISFLKMKVSTQFDTYYKNKYQAYLNKQFLSKQNQSNQQQKVSQFQLYNQDFSKTVRLSSLSKQHTIIKQPTKSKHSQIQKKKRQYDPIKQKQIQTTLINIDFQSIYLYLHQRFQILHLQSAQASILLQFFQQMNNSITHFFSAFKRNLPKIFTERLILQKPDIINNI